MRNFLKICDGVPMGPIQQVLWANPDLWNQQKFRQTYVGTPHSQVDDIWLRFSPDIDPNDLASVQNDTSPIWHEPGTSVLGPVVRQLVLDLMRLTSSWQLDRLLITRLAPGASIGSHADVNGDYVHVKGLARFHCVIQGLPGSMFYCGEEELCMRTGEIWWFNAHEVHSVRNMSCADRIHMLVDCRRWP